MWHSAEDFTCRFLLANRDLDPHHPCRCRSSARTRPWLLLPWTSTGSQTSMPRHHWTSSRLACLNLAVASTPPRTSSTTASSAKQSSCNDGPAENAATAGSSSLPRGSSRMTFRKDSTNRTKYGAGANPFFSLACACQARPQKHCRAISRAPLRTLHDSSTTMSVLSQNPSRPTADANDTWVVQFTKHLAEQRASEYTVHSMMSRSMDVQR